MAPEAERAGKQLLVYDGECPLCIGFSRLYVTLGWVSAPQRVPLLELEPELIERLLALGFGNEMALVEPDRTTIRTGMDGILHLMRGTWARPLAALLGLPGLRQLCELVYRFIGANRRFLSLPRPRGPACACEPDEKPAYNLALVGIASGLAVLCARPFEGASTPGLTPLRQVLFLLPVLFLVWVTLPAGLRLRALGHLAMSMLHAALVLGGGTLLFGNDRAWGLVWVAALLWCGRQLLRRLRYLGVEHALPRAIVLALGSTGLLVAA